MDLGMMERFEEEVEMDYHRDEHNKEILSLIEETAEVAKENGVYDPEAYAAAIMYYSQHAKNGETVLFTGSPVETFVKGSRAQLKNESQGKSM